MEKDKIFSVVMPLYQNRDNWKVAVESVLMQDYPLIELLVCDDGTQDFNCDEVRSFIEDKKRSNLHRFEVISNETNLGTVATMRIMHDKCTGTYLTHIAGDDAYCHPGVLSQYAYILDKKAPQVLGIYGNSQCCDGCLVPMGRVSFDVDEANRLNDVGGGKQYASLTAGCCIHMGATAFLREEFFAAGGFDARYRLIEDWPFFLRTTRQGKRFSYCGFDAIFYRAGGITTSAEFTPEKTACYTDHLRLYEQEILPYTDMLSWSRAKKAYVRYRTDRRAILRAYGRLSSMSLIEIWKMHPRHYLFELVYIVQFVPWWISVHRNQKEAKTANAGGQDD